MNHTQSLPEPSTDALTHSEKLVAVIRQEILDSDSNSISFKRYMEMALYQPNLGYYVAGTHKIGQQGDFVTAPEISSLFSQCVANQCADAMQKVALTLGTNENNCILELGAGSGRMACDILLELEIQNQLPECYYILDLSPDLIQRQQQTLQQHVPHLLERVEWVSSVPENFIGTILGNEVLDAMPVDVFTQHGEDVYEHHVIWQDDKLVEQLKPANKKLKQHVSDLNIRTDTPYTSEINPNINAWLKTLNDSLVKGMILLIDYGYTRSEYYLADRNKGTLICHYQHLVNEAPLKYPGLQDITANVDFTAVAEGADAAGLKVSGFTSQVHFLANTGLESYFMQALEKKPADANTKDSEQRYKLAQQVRTLSLPSEMGERFKCIALTKKMDGDLIGFKAFDQRFRL
ncbi:MAG: SAM-dependent methyltransferase [Cocleimonas sp.]